ncbi:DUF1573 domain-containing protein [Crocinitomix catalasitica]|nr:DUF1573 domain-containing protein [Crocinitomix catalasitica]
MKTISLLLAGALSLSFVLNNEPTYIPSEKKTWMKFETTVQEKNFLKGEDASFHFWFENQGTDPLIVSKVKASCGCTVPEWPREPVMPSQKAEITLKYDSNKVGPFDKTVRVYYNGSTEPLSLTIKGVIEDEK